MIDRNLGVKMDCNCSERQVGGVLFGQSIVQADSPAAVSARCCDSGAGYGAAGQLIAQGGDNPLAVPRYLRGVGGSFKHEGDFPPQMIVEQTGQVGFAVRGNFIGLDPKVHAYVRQRVWIYAEGWTRPLCGGAPDTWELVYVDEIWKVQADGTTMPRAGEKARTVGTSADGHYKMVDEDAGSDLKGIGFGQRECDLCIWRFRIFSAWGPCTPLQAFSDFLKADGYAYYCVEKMRTGQGCLLDQGGSSHVWHSDAKAALSSCKTPNLDGYYGWWSICPCSKNRDDLLPPPDVSPIPTLHDPPPFGPVPAVTPRSTPTPFDDARRRQRFRVWRGYPGSEGLPKPTPQPAGPGVSPRPSGPWGDEPTFPIPALDGGKGRMPLPPVGGVPGGKPAPLVPSGPPAPLPRTGPRGPLAVPLGAHSSIAPAGSSLMDWLGRQSLTRVAARGHRVAIWSDGLPTDPPLGSPDGGVQGGYGTGIKYRGPAGSIADGVLDR